MLCSSDDDKALLDFERIGLSDIADDYNTDTFWM